MRTTTAPVHGPTCEPFKVSAATALFLNATISNKLDLGQSPMALVGDIAERTAQTAQLFAQGIGVGRMDQGGYIHRKDIARAMAIFWNFKPCGWQHYEKAMIQHKVCTPEQFATAKIEPARSKRA